MQLHIGKTLFKQAEKFGKVDIEVVKEEDVTENRRPNLMLVSEPS
jgi:hypothetical protein